MAPDQRPRLASLRSPSWTSTTRRVTVSRRGEYATTSPTTAYPRPPSKKSMYLPETKVSSLAGKVTVVGTSVSVGSAVSYPTPRIRSDSFPCFGGVTMVRA